MRRRIAGGIVKRDWMSLSEEDLETVYVEDDTAADLVVHLPRSPPRFRR